MLTKSFPPSSYKVSLSLKALIVVAVFGWSIASAGTLARTVFINIDGVALQAELESNQLLLDKLVRPVEVGQARFYKGYLTGYPGSAVRLSEIEGRWRGTVVLDNAIYRVGKGRGVEPGVAGLHGEPVNYGDERQQLCGATRFKGKQSKFPGEHRFPMQQAGSAVELLSDMDFDDVPLTGAAVAAEVVETGIAGGNAIAPASIGSPLCANPIDGVCLLPEIEFAYDLSYQNLPGDGQTPIQRALLEINELEMFLQRSFSFRFSRLSLTMLDSAQDALVGSDNSAGSLLDHLRRLRGSGQLGFLQKPRSIFHFVTGRDFPSTNAEGNIVGLAYLQQVCAGSGLNTGLTDAGDTPVVSLVMAHEIGHNLGAVHDDEVTNGCAAKQYVMSGSIGAGSGSITDYSSCSIRDIENEIAANLSTSCFDFPVDVSVTEAEDNPLQPPISTPFLTTLNIQRNDGYVPVRLVQVTGEVADPGQGYFDGASFAGGSCSVTNEGAGFRCLISNPALSSSVDVRSFVFENASEFSFEIEVASMTEGTHEMRPADNLLTVSYSEFSEPPATAPATGTETVDSPVSTLAPVSRGGGGSMDIATLAIMLSVTVLRIRHRVVANKLV